MIINYSIIIMITLTKQQQLRARMQLLGIREADLQEKFIIGSGRGGQKLQKTASCVYLHHVPSGLEVKCQRTRSREDNRYHARKLLCDKLDRLLHHEQSEQQQIREKIRRQKRKRSRRAQAKVLANKAKRSQTKELRKSPDIDE